MPYYNDPSGLASFWVNDGETVDEARRRNAALTAEGGGNPQSIIDPISLLSPEERAYNPYVLAQIAAQAPRPGSELGNVLPENSGFAEQLRNAGYSGVPPSPAAPMQAPGFSPSPTGSRPTFNGTPAAPAAPSAVSPLVPTGGQATAPIVRPQNSYAAPPPTTGTLEPSTPVVAQPQIITHDGGSTGPPPPTTGTLEPMTRLVTADGRVIGIPQNDPQFQQAVQAGGRTLQPGVLPVRMPDGSIRSFNGITTELDAALRAGGMPLDPLTGEDMPARQPFGDGQGWTFGSDNLPANVILGQGWLPGQLEKMLDIQTEGTLLSRYPNTFSWDPSKIQNDPGYQFALSEGEKGINRGAAANLSLLSGKTLKDLERFRTGLASTYSDTYYDRASRDFDRDYNVFENTQNKRFNRLASIAGIGQTAVNQLNSAGSNYGANAGNIITNTGAQNADLLTQAGNARASQFVGQGNVWGQFNPTSTLSDLYLLGRR